MLYTQKKGELLELIDDKLLHVYKLLKNFHEYGISYNALKN